MNEEGGSIPSIPAASGNGTGVSPEAVRGDRKATSHHDASCIPPIGIPSREQARLARLKEFDPCNIGDDPVLEGLARLTALVCETPIGIISLVDEKSVRSVAAHGMAKASFPREISLCTHVIEKASGPLIIPDTLRDERFAGHPLVTGNPHARYYAGVPLLTDEGLPIGALCVIDRNPRKPSAKQLEIMERASETIMAHLARERQRKEMIRMIHLKKEVYSRLLKASSEILKSKHTFDEAIAMLVAQIDPDLGWLSLRLRNMQTEEKYMIKDHPDHSGDPELGKAWRSIDTIRIPAFDELTQSSFLECPALKPLYSYLVVPVRIRGRLIASLEFIYPDHRLDEARLRDLYDVISLNLSILAERELGNIELRHQATHDYLTGAANRSLILEGIKEAVQKCNPLDPEAALLFFDIDGFKEVNDNFGHESGDRLLREVTRRLQGVCRDNDLLGRLSGDEFILLARRIDIEQGLAPLLERIQRNLSLPYMLGDLEIRVHSSIGCAVISQNDVPPNEIIRRAEEAMYLVKNGERRGFCIADEQVVSEFKEKRRIERSVKQAFRDGEMMALFQPIIDLRDGSIIGCETLIRLRCRDGSVMSGHEFLPVIQRSRFQIQLDEFAFAETLRCFRTEEGRRLLELPSFRFTVNVSPAFLATTGYAENCLRLLSEALIPPSRLGIEITESMILPTEKTVILNLDLLRKNGVVVSLDDFGTGYSNLQQLAGFPIDVIKIDRDFITGIARGDLTKNSLLVAILGIGKNLGYKIVAEGVEEQLQADYLRSMGCDYAQGYLYAKPMPIADLVALIGTRIHHPGEESADQGLPNAEPLAALTAAEREPTLSACLERLSSASARSP